MGRGGDAAVLVPRSGGLLAGRRRRGPIRSTWSPAPSANEVLMQWGQSGFRPNTRNLSLDSVYEGVEGISGATAWAARTEQLPASWRKQKSKPASEGSIRRMVLPLFAELDKRVAAQDRLGELTLVPRDGLDPQGQPLLGWQFKVNGLTNPDHLLNQHMLEAVRRTAKLKQGRWGWVRDLASSAGALAVAAYYDDAGRVGGIVVPMRRRDPS